jgi:hypothetical protein
MFGFTSSVLCFHRPDRFWAERYQEDVFNLMPRFKPQELANVLWAMAVLNMKVPEVRTPLNHSFDACMDQLEGAPGGEGDVMGGACGRGGVKGGLEAGQHAVGHDCAQFASVEVTTPLQQVASLCWLHEGKPRRGGGTWGGGRKKQANVLWVMAVLSMKVLEVKASTGFVYLRISMSVLAASAQCSSVVGWPSRFGRTQLRAAIAPSYHVGVVGDQDPQPSLPQTPVAS